MKIVELKIRNHPKLGWCVIALDYDTYRWVQWSKFYSSYERLYRYFILPRKLNIK